MFFTSLKTYKVQVQMGEASYQGTPLLVLVEQSTSILRKEHGRSICLDGISILGKSINVLKCKWPLAFKTKLRVDLLPTTSYKGISILSQYTNVYEIILNQHNSRFTLSLIVCRAPSHSTEMQFRRILSIIHTSINDSIMRLSNSSKTKRLYCQSGEESRTIYRSSMESFSRNLDLRLENVLKKEGLIFYFMMRRMGQDINIGETVSEVCLRKIASHHLEFDPNNTLTISLHVAVDFTPHENEILMWRLKEITRKFGPPDSDYHPLFLPKLGNCSYAWDHMDNLLPIKFVHFYLRMGNHVKRNKGKFFSKIGMSKRLIELHGTLLAQSRAKVKESMFDKQLLSGEVMRLVDALSMDSYCQPPLRCEVVYETRRIGPNAFSIGLFQYLKVAFEASLNFMETSGCLEQNNFLAIPSPVIKAHIDRALMPCKIMFDSFTTQLNTMLEMFRLAGNRQESLEVMFEDVHCCELGTYLDLFAAECIIAYFFCGKLPSGTPKFVHRHLGFLDLETNGISAGTLKLVVFFEDKIKCDVPLTFLCEFIPTWLAASHIEECGELLTWFTELNARCKKTSEDINSLVELISEQFLKLLEFVSVSGAETYQSYTPELSLLKIKANRRDTPGKEVISIPDLLKRFSLGNGITPSIIPNLFQAISKAVTIKGKTENLAFDVFVSKNLSEEITKQKIPLYFGLNLYKVVAVLPVDGYLPEYIQIYSDAFEFLFHRKIGTREIACEDLFAKSLKDFLNELRQSELKISLCEYFNIINFLLNNPDLSSVIKHCKSPNWRTSCLLECYD